MIIASIVISVLAVAVSLYSLSITWRWNRERNRLRRRFDAAVAKGGHPKVLPNADMVPGVTEMLRSIGRQP